MSIVKLNNRSVKDITAFGSISSLGSLTHIATQTASSSASLSFTSGIDSTYKEYIFYFVNIHPASDGNRFLFQGSTNSGSGYGVNITSTFFKTFHNEAGSSAGVSYDANNDLANSTIGDVTKSLGIDNIKNVTDVSNLSSSLMAKTNMSSDDLNGMVNDVTNALALGGGDG